MDFTQNGWSGVSRCRWLMLFGSELGQAEIKNLRVTTLGYEDVGGLDVAVNNALGVCGIERFGNFNREFQQLIGGKRPTQDALAQSLTFEQFHSDEVFAILLSDFVDGADVGMVKGRGSAGLAAKTF